FFFFKKTANNKNNTREKDGSVSCVLETAPTPLCRGGTDYFYKKHYFILGVLLAARCVFL
ncbi:hypothetical protein ABUU06_23555, partial [Escherichia coli]